MFPKIKDNPKPFFKQQPTGIMMVLIVFFFVVPAIPIGLTLLSEQPHSTHPATITQYELTEEGKTLFHGKEHLIQKYMAAGDKYQVPWEYLAAIHQIESNFALTSPPESDQQITSETPIEEIRVGPMGFLERTWVGWGDDSNQQFLDDYPEARTPLSEQGDLRNSFHATYTNPQVIQQYQGIGMDHNGDRIADPYDVDDAIFTAAKKLKADSGKNGDFKKALERYHLDPNYANTVEKTAQNLASMVKITSSSEQVPTGSIKSMIDHAYQLYNNRTINYIFGADSYPNFDCSSWVKYMYKKHLGIQLMRTTYYQVNQGTYVPKDQLQPGDLVFFARGSDVYHVGMYVGNGMMIHNANSRLDMKLDTINSGYYANYYHSGRRYSKADSVE